MEISDPPMSFLFALPIITYISYDITKKVQIRGFAMVLLLFDFLEKMIAFWNMEYPPQKKTRKLTGLPRFPAFLESPNWKKNGPSNEIPLFPTLFGPPVEALNSVRAVGDLNSMLQEAPVDRSRHGKKPTGEREGVSWRKKGRKHTP